MRTLHPAYRVTDLEVSLAFYEKVGYDVLGRADIGGGTTLAFLKFPGEEVVTLELVYRPADGPVVLGSAFSHLPVQVDDLAATIEALTAAGLEPGPVQHHGDGDEDGPRTSWLIDPDGYRLELVQWPPGHPYGLTAADFAQT